MRKINRDGAFAQMLGSMDADSLRRTRDKMRMAARIADILEERGISQKQFAAMMHKTESVISDWLSGDRNFTISTLSDISAVLGVPLLNFGYAEMEEELAYAQ